MSVVTPDSFRTFGELLKYLRHRAHLSQRALAVAVGYSDAQITRLESGQRLPDPMAVRARFIEALNLQQEPELEQRLIESAERAQEGDGARSTPLSAEDRPLSAPSSGVPTNLPRQLTHFIGRERDVAEVRHLIAANPLVTLTGSGGVGKTRLAIEVGAAFVGAMHRLEIPVDGDVVGGASPLHFPDGVWLAELAPIADPALVPDTVVAALGLPAATGPATERLAKYLHARRLLLILDNCEHLIQACAELAGTLLAACPELHILATSREALNIPGEIAWRVPSLEETEAAALFVDRAQAVRHGFAISEENADTIREICRQLDGIPLAIELAAARLRVLSAEQIAARLGDRFHLLTGGSRTALPRHQTLRAMIDASYELLPRDEEMLLRQLSVFAGGWTLEAAEAVHGTTGTLVLLDGLVNKSLVVMDDGAHEPRYHLLETIRQYAHEKLSEANETEEVAQRHLAYFTRLAQTASTYLNGPETRTWLDRLEMEHDNLRAALACAARDDNALQRQPFLEGLL